MPITNNFVAWKYSHIVAAVLSRAHCPALYNGISIAFNQEQINPGIFLKLSSRREQTWKGQSCENLKFNWNKFFSCPMQFIRIKHFCTCFRLYKIRLSLSYLNYYIKESCRKTNRPDLSIYTTFHKISLLNRLWLDFLKS